MSMPITVVNSMFPGENVAPPPTTLDVIHSLCLPFDTFAPEVNDYCGRYSGYLMICHGARLVSGWESCVDLMEMGASVVSPWQRYHPGVKVEPFDPIGADCYFTHSEVIARCGGLCTDVLFGHHRILDAQIRAWGGWTVKDEAVTYTLTFDSARMEAVGSLYYRQIADWNTVDAIVAALDHPPNQPPDEPPPLEAV